jgi:single-stranded-DNA-specific exonuclease
LFVQKQWQVAPRAPETHFELCHELQPLVVQILYNREITGLQEIENFLSYQWQDDDPLGLKGMPQAVERLSQAIVRREPIAVYGDYDADGVTAAALMVQLLMALKAQAEVYIPNRFEEGYGLNNEALAQLASRGVKLVLTVDCGIRSVQEVAYGNSLGLDIIITDHHTVGPEIPPALAAINPKQPGCAYPFKELAGVGLAYKLAQALLRADIQRPAYLTAQSFLDLVAIGTVADLAPLSGENRQLVAHGLRQLNRSLRPGLAALMAAAGLNPNYSITAGTIGFMIGPRLNAAGRLDSALAAYELLMAQNQAEARQPAEKLEAQNRERQKLTHEIVQAARQRISAQEPGPLYFIAQPDFNPGVVGLAASRLLEDLYRPVLVAEQGPEFTKGSARSIPEFHITEALDQCADILVRYGGHAAAAGFTVRNENVPVLQARLLQIANSSLNVQALQPTLKIDARVNLRGVRYTLIENILNLEPFGYKNPTPCFMSEKLRIKYSKAVGQDQQHLRLVLHDGRQDWSAIAFRQGHWAAKLSPAQYIDVVYYLEFNQWNGERQMQLNIQDLRPSRD